MTRGQILFALEKARYGLAMPYDAEAVKALEDQLKQLERQMQPKGPAVIPVKDVKVGDVLIADNGFDCMVNLSRNHVLEADDGLYVVCAKGRHYLSGQLDVSSGTLYVGFWKEQSNATD